MSERERILEKIDAIVQELEAVPKRPDYGSEAVDEKRFIFLLGSIALHRQIPGLGPVRLGQPAFCRTKEDAEKVREHLREIYKVTDYASLREANDMMFSTDSQYRQLMSFWDDTPLFDESKLKKREKKAFEASLEYARPFRKYVGDHGFYAWDCSERIGLLYTATACGMISEEDFWSEAKLLARRASGVYSSWIEYAVSSLCGCIFFLFAQNGYVQGGLEKLFDNNLEAVRHLVFESGDWSKSSWRPFEEKKFILPASELRELLTDWTEADGCIATDRITVDGEKVGYMFRETPRPGLPDSGWRFFAGDEPEEYVQDATRFEVYTLNTICNYDEDILPLLKEPIGTAFVRDENGKFQKEG